GWLSRELPTRVGTRKPASARDGRPHAGPARLAQLACAAPEARLILPARSPPGSPGAALAPRSAHGPRSLTCALIAPFSLRRGQRAAWRQPRRLQGMRGVRPRSGSLCHELQLLSSLPAVSDARVSVRAA